MIVATIGLQLGALDLHLFTAIVAMAVVTTMAMPSMLRWAFSRVPMSEEERARLEREEFEARAFLPRIERQLIAVDDSASGSFASHLAGLLAAARRTPTTVLARGPHNLLVMGVSPGPGDQLFLGELAAEMSAINSFSTARHPVSEQFASGSVEVL